MLILDASGSMWGQIDSVPKIQIAKDVIGDLVSEWDADMRLGLMAYGHRREGDCGDIELLSPVSDVDAQAIMETVSPLNPRGKTPISASVQQAAETLKYTEERATVILVSDGLETCNADPCALAKTLEETGVDFTTHVIGFDLKEEEFEALQCLAKETGGAFLNAGNAADLSAALKETVSTTEKALQTGLQIYAVPCETCDPVTDVSFSWSVFAVDEEGSPDRERTDFGTGQGGYSVLPPGRYQVTGLLDSDGDLSGDALVDVTDEGFTVVRMNMDVGRIEYRSRPTAESEPITDDALYTFFGPENSDGDRPEHAVSIKASGSQWVPAGEGLLSVKHGLAKHEELFVIEAGETQTIDANLNIGYILATAYLNGDERAPKNSDFWVTRKDDGPDFSKRLTFKKGNGSRFVVQQGEYWVTGDYEDARQASLVSVTAGETSDVAVDLKAGTLNLGLIGSDGTPLTQTLNWRVTPDSKPNNPQNRALARGAQPRLILSEGDYIVTTSYDGNRVKENVSIRAGDSVDLTIQLGAP